MKLTLDSSVEIILKLSKEEVRKLSYNVLTAEHVMGVAIKIPPIKRLLESLKVDVNTLRVELEKYIALLAKKNQSRHVLENFYDTNPTSEPKKSESFSRLMESAYLSTAKEERSIVGLRDVLLAFTVLEQQNATNFPYSNYININKFRSALRYDIDTSDDLSDIEIEMFGSLYNEEVTEFFLGDDDTEEDPALLSKLTTNLCEKAKQNKDVFVGQEETLYSMYEALLRKNKNNVILIGDPGVGKTALVQEFGKKLVNKDVPDELKGYTLLSLDIMALVAGTRYRGDFEDRVKQLIDGLVKMKNCILFLDDIHSIITAGASTGNSNDFGDLIKPLLVDNVVRCIGATTHEELKIFEKEKALLRRFNFIEMKECNEEETFTILESVRPIYEKHFSVKYSNEILKDIIYLSKKYITERAFPDKAIDIMDSVGANLRLQDFKKNSLEITSNKKKTKKTVEKTQVNNTVSSTREVLLEDIESIIGRISKRPVKSIKKNEFDNLVNLSTRLSKKIFGQSHAVKALSRVIIRSRSGLREESKPIASLLFVGPTGVGKTEISKQLALELGMNFQRFDMSEYQESHTLSKFIGSPPGYVGHEQGGLLVENIRRHPNSVLLLDEIEKAHPDIFNLLLQVMDYATITDATGKKADFRNVVIIMTSNAGAKESTAQIVGFEKSKFKGNDEIKEAVNNLFSPEFRNRLDDTIVFSALETKHMRSIVLKELHTIKSRLMEKNITLEWDSKVVTFLVKKGYSPIYGARGILRLIEEDVKDRLAEIIIIHHSSAQSDELLITLSHKKEHGIDELIINYREQPVNERIKEPASTTSSK